MEKTYIQERIRNLYALKELYSLQSKAYNWMQKANMKEVTAPSSNDYRTQISATVKMKKDADLLSAQPEWSFIPTDASARTNRKIARYAWDYHWLISNTDEAICDVVQSSTTYGTGVMFD